MQERCLAAPISMVAALLLLAGCTTSQRITARNITPVQYASVTEALKGSPALRRNELRTCVAKTRRAAAAQHAAMAALMNLSPRQDPATVYCQRAMQAFVSGRISYADFQQLRDNQISPKFIRIIQGR